MQSGVRSNTFLHSSFSAYVTKSRLSQVSLEDILCSGFRRTAYFEKGGWGTGLQLQKQAENQSIQAISLYPSKLQGQRPRFHGVRDEGSLQSGKRGTVQSIGRSLALVYSNMAVLN